jgi:hypothetical protein
MKPSWTFLIKNLNSVLLSTCSNEKLIRFFSRHSVTCPVQTEKHVPQEWCQASCQCCTVNVVCLRHFIILNYEYLSVVGTPSVEMVMKHRTEGVKSDKRNWNADGKLRYKISLLYFGGKRCILKIAFSLKCYKKSFVVIKNTHLVWRAIHAVGGCNGR